MAVPLPHPNQVIGFQTNYFKDGHNLTGFRYYLLKEIKEEKKLLVFFSITSNSSRDWVIASQYKIKERPPCLDSEIYLNSFVNTNCLINVPLELFKFFEKVCRNCPQFCLKRREFSDIIKLHYDIVKYQELLRVEVKIINLVEKNFIFD